jgi:hypothetical protein
MIKIMRKKLGTPKVPATGSRAMAKKVKKRKRASLNLPKKGAGRRRPGFDAFEVSHFVFCQMLSLFKSVLDNAA